ncbi:MAG TPA: hypothetical protein VJS69_01190 [Candidatus Krumholzibacteria bacterium]|nr:hypothetical protein [Candidatus Krumholzibacteria bacterium]
MKDDVKMEGYTRDQALAAVGKGWAPLVNKIFDQMPPGHRVVQVKEKLSKLRVYARCDFDALLADLEEKSATICEDCGQPGKLRNITGWMRTLCDADAERALAKRKAQGIDWPNAGAPR